MADKQVFPRITEKSYWIIRDQFKKTIPQEVNTTYLRSLLGFSTNKAASNLIAPLKQIGLIDEDGKPTERANLWRNDGKYPEVCQQIIEDVYPSGLKDLYSGSNIELSDVRGWFELSGQLGQEAARQSASMYMLLNEAEPKSSAEFITKPKPKKKVEAKPEIPKEPEKESTIDTVAEGKQSSTNSEPQSQVQPQSQSRNIWGKGMSLHIDLQIHISHQATPEQIDSIFASMAKHLPNIANQEGSDEE